MAGSKVEGDGHNVILCSREGSAFGGQFGEQRCQQSGRLVVGVRDFDYRPLRCGFDDHHDH